MADTITIYGLYQDRDALERAVSELKELGFSNNNISVVFPDEQKTQRFAVEHATKAPEGALAGGGTGLVVGGVLGWLAGIGTFALPGIGPIIAAGPLVAAITGAGVGSAVGGLAGALIGHAVARGLVRHHADVRVAPLVSRNGVGLMAWWHR